MSEKLSHIPETQQNILEHQKPQYEVMANEEKSHSEHHHKHAEHIEHIRANIDRQADRSETAKEQLQSNEQQPTHHHYATKKIKSDQYKKTLVQIRQNLPKNQQKFSSFVHQTSIERISEIGAKTIARPTGIISGAVLALIGSLVVMFVGHRVGFEVPNSIFTVLFIVGFLIGICVELITLFINKLRPKHRRYKEFYD